VKPAGFSQFRGDFVFVSRTLWGVLKDSLHRVDGRRVFDDHAGEDLKIEGALTLECVSDVRARLLAELTRPGELRCDLSAVDRCDTAGVQLLCSAVATATLAGRSLVVTPSAAVLAAAARIGVDQAAIGHAEPRS
jgi:ABC-type transporter Mla MlaB component